MSIPLLFYTLIWQFAEKAFRYGGSLWALLWISGLCFTQYAGGTPRDPNFIIHHSSIGPLELMLGPLITLAVSPTVIGLLMKSRHPTLYLQGNVVDFHRMSITIPTPCESHLSITSYIVYRLSSLVLEAPGLLSPPEPHQFPVFPGPVADAIHQSLGHSLVLGFAVGWAPTVTETVPIPRNMLRAHCR